MFGWRRYISIHVLYALYVQYVLDVLYLLYILYVLYVHTRGKIFCMTLMMKGVAEGRSGALREVMRLFSLIFSLSAKCTAMNRQRNLRRKNWIWPISITDTAISITNTDNLLISRAITMTKTKTASITEDIFIGWSSGLLVVYLWSICGLFVVY